MSDPTDKMTDQSDLAGGTLTPPRAASEPPVRNEQIPPRLSTSPPPATAPPSRGTARVGFSLDDFGRSEQDPPPSSVPGSSRSGGRSDPPPAQFPDRQALLDAVFGPNPFGSYSIGEGQVTANPAGELNIDAERSRLFDYNMHELEQELKDFGTEYLSRKYAKKIGQTKADKMMGLLGEMYFQTYKRAPPNMTSRGQELLAELEIANKKRQPVIGGDGLYYHPQKYRNYNVDHELALEQEINLTYTRDEDNNPLYRQLDVFAPNADEGGGEMFVHGYEQLACGIMKQMNAHLTDQSKTVEERMAALGHAMNELNRQKYLDDARFTDLKMDEAESKLILVPAPLLKVNGDPTGDINDKTFRDIRGRLGDRLFDGGGNDLTCVHYLEEIRAFIQGRFNPAASYAIVKATTAGEPYQYTVDQQRTQISFHHFWNTFAKTFGKEVDPQIALGKLQELRNQRPNRLSSRLIKIQNLAGAASYSVVGPKRLTKMVQLFRDEVVVMLGVWFPAYRKQILLTDKKASARWRAERATFRMRGDDPDTQKLRTNYHPLNSLFDLCLTVLNDVEPEERPKGYVPRYQRPAGQVVKKKQRRPGVYAVQDEDEGFRDDTRDEEAILREYAESIADTEILSDDGYSDEEYLPYHYSSEEEEGDPEIEALHARPGEVMRRFQQGARPREGSRARPPKDRDHRERAHPGGGDRRPRPPRQADERPPRPRLSNRFPNVGKGIVSRICKNCLSPNHSFEYCGAYDGAVPGEVQRPCCHGYHVGDCMKDKARELEQKKRERAAERERQKKERN